MSRHHLEGEGVRVETQRRVRALLADDHERMKDAVERILGPTFDITRVADGEELVRAVACSRPDVMIVDISMPKLSGIEALKKLQKRNGPLPPTIVCSMHREKTLLREALKAGARGYVYKARAPFDLPQAIEAAMEDRRFVSPGLEDDERARRKES